jgi:primosomal protein N' (replication factor Y)
MVQQAGKVKFGSGQRVEVLLPKPFDHGFDYRVPEGMWLSPGDYVDVPFGKTPLCGVVWGEGKQEVAEEKCKAVLAHHSLWPPLSDAMRRFIDRAAAYTLSPKGLMLKMTLPLPEMIRNPQMQICYQAGGENTAPLTNKRKAVLDLLHHGAMEKMQLMAQSGASAAVLKGMEVAGLITPQQHAAADAPVTLLENAPTLRPEQQEAADTLAASQGFTPFLLDGITGSGKTEVYFDRFGFKPHLWHSSVSVAQRKKSWQRIAGGSARVVVGARSALFLPYRNLQLLVVDEEHEASYKQEDGVIYHARDMAVLRGKEEDIPVILASATPSLESTVNAQRGKYQEVCLRERHGDFDEIPPQLIDLRQDKPERGCWVSPTLRTALHDTLKAGHQSLLFLNRRGYAPLLLCRTCGHRFQCPNCDSWMVMHQKPARLQCHQCDWRMPMPSHCPECNSTDSLVACGPGVERIEEEVAELYPTARIVTLSSDEGELPAQIHSIIAGEADIIIGTQMVAKGHDFGRLALVGIVDGDLGLFGGDLRASERCYQLMHQLAGRAGRDAVEGRVFLQTTQPEHPVMQALEAGDRPGFVQQELNLRKRAGWPPYGRLAAVLLEGFDETQVKQTAMQLVRQAPQQKGVVYLGPAPALIARSRNKWRYRILIKAKEDVRLQPLLRQWLGGVKTPSAVRLKVDIDPLQLV